MQKSQRRLAKVEKPLDLPVDCGRSPVPRRLILLVACHGLRHGQAFDIEFTQPVADVLVAMSLGTAALETSARSGAAGESRGNIVKLIAVPDLDEPTFVVVAAAGAPSTGAVGPRRSQVALGDEPASVDELLLGSLASSLDRTYEVVVVVDAGNGAHTPGGHVCGRIALASAIRAGLVLLDTGNRAASRTAGRTSVLGWLGEADAAQRAENGIGHGRIAEAQNGLRVNVVAVERLGIRIRMWVLTLGKSLVASRCLHVMLNMQELRHTRSFFHPLSGHVITTHYLNTSGTERHVNSCPVFVVEPSRRRAQSSSSPTLSSSSPTLSSSINVLGLFFR